jgi:hypothetical protein
LRAGESGGDGQALFWQGPAPEDRTIAGFHSEHRSYNPATKSLDSFMSLSAGTRIGPYEVAGSLGAGGMGEVHRAHSSTPYQDRR